MDDRNDAIHPKSLAAQEDVGEENPPISSIFGKEPRRTSSGHGALAGR